MVQNEDGQKKTWAAWLSVPGIGRETFAKIKDFAQQHHRHLEELWRRPQSLSLLSEAQKRSLATFQKQYSVDDYWEWLLQQQIGVVTIVDSTYPTLLKQTYDPPWLLFVKGNLDVATMIAVVGTRRNTLYGQQTAQKIVSELVLEEVSIVSGFMYGIDTIAHQTAVSAGGKTIAVLGYGFNHVGPRSHQQLYQQWLKQPDQVVFISEYPPSTPPKAGLFPMRNRIVAGMSQAVVVVEAAERSGSLITAQIGLDNGRAVCAVPGSIFSRYSQGTRNLINQGACLVTSGHEVLEELGWGFQSQIVTPKQQPPVTLEQKILRELNADSQTIDDLQKLLQVPIQQLTSALIDLEIKGALEKEGNLYCLA